MTGWRRWFQVGPRDVGADVDDEVAFHLEELERRLRSDGLTPDAAKAEAARRFGATAPVRSNTLAHAARTERRGRRLEWLGEVLHDLRFGLRLARRQPGFTTALLLVLTLGIGAHTAIATAFHAVLLRPLPYAEPERLVYLWETAPDLLGGRSEASFPDFLDWRAQAGDLFAGLEGYDPTNMVATGDGPARMLPGARVTSGFLDLLGVRPALGRAFRPGEDLPGGAPVAVLSHGFWLRAFGGDSGALGRSLALNGRAYQIVGVLPREFHFGALGNLDFMIPLDMGADTRAQRFNHWLNVVGRLRTGVTLAGARAGMETVVARVAAAHSESHAGRTGLVVPLSEEFTGSVRPVLIALAGAVSVLLIIACSNAGSLLLARSLSRVPELRLRAALGAGRGRLVRQLVTEAVALALIAGIGGAMVARIGIRLLVSAVPAGMLSSLPALRDLTMDWRVFGYAMAVSLLTGLAFGVVPGLGLSRSLAPGQLRATGRRGLRDGLVAGQLALTVVLLAIAGLLTRSLTSLARTDLGFSTDRTVTFRYSLSGPAYQEDTRQQRFADGLLERLRGLPGVRHAGAVTSLPLQPGGTNTFRVEGRPEPPPSAHPEATMRGVAGDYFTALGIPLVAGRTFTPDDAADRPPVVVLDESSARRLFGEPGVAVGARLRFYAFPDTVWTVIGVVGAVKTGRLDEPPPPTIYYSHLQAAENRLSVVVRLAGPVEALLSAARGLVAELDPAVPFYGAETLRDRVADSPAIFVRRYPLILIGGFGLAAALIAVAGLYAVLSHNVASRTKEIGIRAALGATPGALVRLVIRRGGLLVAIGMGTGLIGALLASRGVARLLYDVPPGDPVTLAAVALLLGILALGATWSPARRAARTSPLLALREE